MKTGMRAVDGAVSYVKLQDDRFALMVIGGGTPKGLCGSGIVDLIAQLRLNGKIDLLGKFRRQATLVEEIHGELGIAYAPGLYFVQSDIDEFLRAKAAANTMVEYMMDQIGMTMDDVDRFYVAGAFGAYLDRESAVTIGLYPDIPREKLCSAGNTSLEGARMLLCRREIWLALPWDFENHGVYSIRRGGQFCGSDDGGQRHSPYGYGAVSLCAAQTAGAWRAVSIGELVGKIFVFLKFPLAICRTASYNDLCRPQQPTPMLRHGYFWGCENVFLSENIGRGSGNRDEFL